MRESRKSQTLGPVDDTDPRGFVVAAPACLGLAANRVANSYGIGDKRFHTPYKAGFAARIPSAGNRNARADKHVGRYATAISHSYPSRLARSANRASSGSQRAGRRRCQGRHRGGPRSREIDPLQSGTPRSGDDFPGKRRSRSRRFKNFGVFASSGDPLPRHFGMRLMEFRRYQFET